MKMICDKRVTCPSTSIPLSNYSSEDPDRHIYYGAYYRGNTPPTIGGNTPVPVGCGVIGSSISSPAEAVSCAERTSEQCATGTTLPDPCQVCRPESLGNTFGFFTAGTGDNCCDPSAPVECCCDPTTENPPQDPPDGGGTPPNNPGNPPGNQLYCNDAQDCVVDCGDGTLASGHVAACQYFATSKTYANRVAHSEACRRANEKLICWEDHGGGLNCVQFCVNVEADYDLQATAKNGGDISFEIVDGNLPAGLEMDEAGHISGIPTGSGGDAIAHIQMTDEDGNTSTQTFCATVMGLLTTALPNGQVCSAYSTQLVYIPSTAKITVSGLPSALCSNSTGLITGTVHRATGVTVHVVVTNNGKDCEYDLPMTITNPGQADAAADITWSFTHSGAPCNSVSLSGTGASIVFKSSGCYQPACGGWQGGGGDATSTSLINCGVAYPIRVTVAWSLPKVECMNGPIHSGMFPFGSFELFVNAVSVSGIINVGALGGDYSQTSGSFIFDTICAAGLGLGFLTLSCNVVGASTLTLQLTITPTEPPFTCP